MNPETKAQAEAHLKIIEEAVKAGAAIFKRGTNDLAFVYVPETHLATVSHSYKWDFSKCREMTLAEAHYYVGTMRALSLAQMKDTCDRINALARQQGKVEEVDASDTPCVRFCAGDVALIYDPRSGGICTFMNPAGKEIFDFSKSRRMSRETARRVVTRSLDLSESEKAFHVATIDAPTDAETDAKNNNLT